MNLDQLKLENEKILLEMKSSKIDLSESLLNHRRQTEVQIDAGEISLVRSTEDIQADLKSIVDGRYATAKFNQLDSEPRKRVVQSLREASLSSPVDEFRHLIEGVDEIHASYGPLEPDTALMIKKVNEFSKEVKSQWPDLKLEQAGLSHFRSSVSRLNTLKLNTTEEHGYYSFTAMFSGKRGAKSSSFNYHSADSLNLDTPLLKWGAFEKIVKSSIEEIDQTPLTDKFAGDLVIAPEALSSFLGPVLNHLGDNLLIADTSVLKDKMNEQVFSKDLSIRSTPQNPRLARREFLTPDGYLSESASLVEKGVLKSWLLSDYGSRKLGLPRGSSSGALLEIDSGEQSRDELISGVERGIYIGRFSGGAPAVNGDFSGVAKSAFLIEKGKIGKPISEAMISGNLFESFKKIKGISKERLNTGQSLIPWLVFPSISIS